MSLTTAFAATIMTVWTATGAEALRIEAEPNALVPGQYIWSVRNVGTETVTMAGGQFNGRDDCMIVPATTHIDASAVGASSDIIEHHLRSIESLKAKYEGLEGVKLLYAPFDLRVGEGAFLDMLWSPCSENGSEVVQILIRTNEGEYSFSR